jgi:soluble lytic murein transglycosylase-like protein
MWIPRAVQNTVYVNLAHVYGVRHGVSSSLVCAVCEQESGKRNAVIPAGLEDWDPNATRFEPAFETRYIKPANPSMPSTEDLTLAMSFGFMQVMGQTARELGYTGRFLTGLCDPETGLEFGCRKLARCMAEVNNDPPAALLRYNGGSDPVYPHLVLARMLKYA